MSKFQDLVGRLLRATRANSTIQNARVDSEYVQAFDALESYVKELERTASTNDVLPFDLERAKNGALFEAKYAGVWRDAKFVGVCSTGPVVEFVTTGDASCIGAPQLRDLRMKPVEMRTIYLNLYGSNGICHEVNVYSDEKDARAMARADCVNIAFPVKIPVV